MRTLIVVSIFLLSTMLGFAQEPRFSWNRIGPDGGNISCFIEVDSVLLVGTPGGMFRSLDYGNSWQLIERGLPNTPFTVGGFAYCQGVVFAGIGNSRTDGILDLGTRLFASTNHGESWYAVDPENRINGVEYNRINVLDGVDSTLILSVFLDIGAFVKARTWRSLDKGATWTQVSGISTDSFFPVPQIPHKGNSMIKMGKILLLTSGLGVVRSEDNGITWQSQQMLSTLNYRRRSSLLRSGDDLFLGLDSMIYVSRDTGKSWQSIGFTMPVLTFPQQELFIADLISVKDSFIVALCPVYTLKASNQIQSQGTLMASGDKGKTWHLRPASTNAIPFSAPLFLTNTKRGLFYIGADNSLSSIYLQNGLWRSNDDGQSWKPTNEGIFGYYPSFLVSTRKQVYAFTDLGRFFSMPNNILGVPNNTFQRIYSDSLFSSKNSILRFAFAIDTILFLSSSSDLRKSNDGGKTWQNETSNYFQDSTKPFIQEAQTLEQPNGFVSFAISSRGPVYSRNMGVTWLPIPRLSNKIQAHSLELAIENATKTIYIKIDDSVFVSSNAGQTWDANVDREAFMRVKSIRIGNILILIKGTPFDGFFGPRPAQYSRDNGKTFQESLLGLPSTVQIRHLLLQGTTLYAATSRGIYATDIATGISRTNTRETFSVFCAPNPSQDMVQVRFTLPSPAQTRIELSDMLGRTALPPITEERGAGEHSTTFSVEGLSSGVYSVRLMVSTAAGFHTETTRLMVVR